jgi:hypothetical protein
MPERAVKKQIRLKRYIIGKGHGEQAGYENKWNEG